MMSTSKVKPVTAMRGPSAPNSVSSIVIKVVDMYDFRHEVTLEEAVTLNQVEERVKEQSRVWWAYEANRGAGWYLQPDLASTNDATLVSTALELSQALNSNLRAPFSSSSSSGARGRFRELQQAVSTVGNSMLLKRLVRKGIPPTLRPRVWRAVSGAAKKKASAPENYYKELIKEVLGKETAATAQIENDIRRTFPGHPRIDSIEGLAALRRVLVAYSWRDSRVGYCQGMNYVAGYLLLVMKSEEEAFWMLATLLEDILFFDSYSEDLFGCHVEQRVLKELLNKKLPRLSAHLDRINFDASLVTTEWFLCIFAKSFPSETTLRVWDVLFNEGGKVLFRVALALFKMKEEDLMAARHVGEAVKIIQHLTHHLFDPDELLTVAFDKLGTFSMTSISKQRTKQLPAVQAEIDGRLRKLRLVDERHFPSPGDAFPSSASSPASFSS